MEINVSDVVVLTEDLPGQYLFKGQKGTVVDIFGPTSFEVEFLDNDGNVYCVIPLENSKFKKDE